MRALAALLLLLTTHPALAETVADWRREFPKTDFSKTVIDLDEIASDGAIRDSIPPVGTPRFKPAVEIKDVGELEPVLSIGINGDFRAYPLRLLLWHEIVNDVVGGRPLLISYCPLCNSGVVFDRRLADGRVLEFGNTGRLRHFDMVMYDKATESWWQQFEGRAIIGGLAGTLLKPLPARLESLAKFSQRAPRGKVLVPEDPSARAYGTTPYVRMDTGRPNPDRFPFPLPKGVGALDRVVVVGNQAWTLKALSTKTRITAGDLVLSWQAGQNSIHDTKWIAFGRDVGNVVVQRAGADVPYDVTFAFAFAAFRPEGTLHQD